MNAVPDLVRRRVARWVRIATTGISFASFGIGGLVLAVFFFPCVRFAAKDARQREERVQYLVHRAFRLHVRLMQALGVLRLSVRAGERLRRPGGQLLVANHPTLLDVVLIGSLMPQFDCLVKTGAWSNPFMRGVVRAAGYVPNDLGEAVVEACAARLREGRSLLLFPEGTRSPKGGLGRFHRGAAHVALASGLPLRPLVVTCDPPSLMRGQHWYDVPERMMTFTIDVGDAIDPRALTKEGESRGTASRRLTAALRDFYEARLYDRSRCGVGDALQGRDLQVGHRRDEDGIPFPRSGSASRRSSGR